ncbi:MAG: tRNA 2-selenouridine(34) synthase MnmH [Bdellovibrionaceae bacterium]|nr:tRNA 2-selenouridine(34) synthase MnmH [Pseudobdellovibrionaceae bacterium]
MTSEELQELFSKRTSLIDVRAPVEFAQGHLPGAINLPILNDEERALIGTLYKKEGNEAAVQLGFKIVSGEIKNTRLQKWLDFISQNPETVIYCFRGGLRSQITQQWIQQAGVARPLIKGGYKRARNFLIEEMDHFSKNSSLLILSGTTGSGKTSFLHELKSFYPTIDLESLACHRGSAFGAMSTPQPSQINFENELAVSLLAFKYVQNRILIEDESRLIGQRAVPKPFFDKMRASPVLWIDETLENRVNNIFQDYIHSIMFEKESLIVLNVFARYKNSVQNISKKLGGLRTLELLDLLQKAENEFLSSKNLDFNKEWIEKLLIYYYDPMYLNSLDSRQVNVLFKGSRSDCADFLKSLKMDVVNEY